jgi:hypothetical protein
MFEVRPMSFSRFRKDDAEKIEAPLSLIRVDGPPLLPVQQMKSRLPYPPPFQDLATLSEHICTAPSTIEHWVTLGLFPPPKKLGGKCLWSWKEVEGCLSSVEDATTASGDDLLRIREATRKIVESTRETLVKVG